MEFDKSLTDVLLMLFAFACGFATCWFVVDVWPKKPGLCECGHVRSAHRRGRGPCVCARGPLHCACQLFIQIDGSGDDPELVRLRRMVGMKS